MRFQGWKRWFYVGYRDAVARDSATARERDPFGGASVAAQDGTRKIISIAEVHGSRTAQSTSATFFSSSGIGVTEAGKVQGRFRSSGEKPKILERLRISGIEVPPQIFDEVVDVNFVSVVSATASRTCSPTRCGVKRTARSPIVWQRAMNPATSGGILRERGNDRPLSVAKGVSWWEKQ